MPVRSKTQEAVRSDERPIEATDLFVSEQDQLKAKSQEKALEEARKIREAEVAKATQGEPRVPKPMTAPSYAPTGEGARQSVMEWGPYPQYVLAETPYGRYGVEPGYVMFFERYTYFNDREKRMMVSHRPIYIWFGTGPGIRATDLDGNVLGTDEDPVWEVKPDPNYGKNRDQLIRGLPEGITLEQENVPIQSTPFYQP